MHCFDLNASSRTSPKSVCGWCLEVIELDEVMKVRLINIMSRGTNSGRDRQMK